MASSPSPREMMIVVFRHKHPILIAFLAPVLIALALAFLAPTIFEADAKLLVRAGREYVAALETGSHGAIPPSSTMQDAIDTEVEILTSKDVLGDVLDVIGINRLYPALANPKPSWFASEAGAAVQDKAVVRNLAIKALAEDLRVKPIKLSNVIELSLRNPSRVVAIETLTSLLTAFRARHIAAFSRQRSAALDEQLHRYLAEIAGLEKERADYSNTNRLFAAGEQRTALIQHRARGAQELQEVTVRRAALEEQVRYLGAQIQTLPKTVKLETQTQPSPASEETEKALQALRAKEGLYVAHFRPDSAMLRDLRTQIATHEQMLTQRKTISSVRTGVNPLLPALETQWMAARTELAPLAGKETDLAAAIARTDERLREIGKTELRLMNLDRRISQLNTATTTLHQRLQDARFLDDLDRQHLTSVNVIDTPAAAERPVAPRKMLYGIGGLICGLVTGCGAFLMALTFGNRFLSVEMTERVLGVPVIAVIPLPRPAPLARAPKALAAPVVRPWFMGEAA